jgi:hypothetical protein
VCKLIALCVFPVLCSARSYKNKIAVAGARSVAEKTEAALADRPFQQTT